MKVNIGKYPKGNSERKIEVHIEPFDTYSLDHTLALIILPALLQLKATKHGVPSEFADMLGEEESGQDSFDFVKEDHNWAFDEKCKQWEEILDKMIWSFQQIVLDNYEEQYHHGEPKYDWVPCEEKYKDPITGKIEDVYTMVDKNPGEHWVDYEGMKKHEERIQEGLELFGKYYKHLWD